MSQIMAETISTIKLCGSGHLYVYASKFCGLLAVMTHEKGPKICGIC